MNVDVTGMTPEQIAEITSAKSVQEITKKLEQMQRGSRTEYFATSGGYYPIGKGKIKPCSVDVIPCLAAINSPFVGARDEYAPSDIIDAVYCIANGAEAIDGLMAMEYRLRTLDELNEKVSNNPQLFQVLLQQRDTIVKESLEPFRKKAIEYWQTNCAGASLQEAADLVTQILIDGMAPLDMLPRNEIPDSEKKRLDNQNRGAGFSRIVRNILGWIRTKFSTSTH